MKKNIKWIVVVVVVALLAFSFGSMSSNDDGKEEVVKEAVAEATPSPTPVEEVQSTPEPVVEETATNVGGASNIPQYTTEDGKVLENPNEDDYTKASIYYTTRQMVPEIIEWENAVRSGELRYEEYVYLMKDNLVDYATLSLDELMAMGGESTENTNDTEPVADGSAGVAGDDEDYSKQFADSYIEYTPAEFSDAVVVAIYEITGGMYLQIDDTGVYGSDEGYIGVHTMIPSELPNYYTTEGVDSEGDSCTIGVTINSDKSIVLEYYGDNPSSREAQYIGKYDFYKDYTVK